MASGLCAPAPFSFTGDLAAQWSTWKQQFEWYIKATKSGENDEEVKVAILLTLLGAEGLKIYNTFVFAAAGDEKKIKPVLDKFKEHFEPSRSECFERFKFLSRHQRQNESCETWMVELRGLMKNCDYGDKADSILRDQLVMGVADPTSREKMLFEKDLKLDDAIKILRACESSKAQLERMRSAESSTAVVHRLSTQGGQQGSSQQSSGTTKKSQESGARDKQCSGCGRRHPQGKCWAADKKCHECGEKGHLQRFCKSKSGTVHMIADSTENDKSAGHNKIHQLDSISTRRGADYFVIDSLGDDDSSSEEWYESMKLEGADASFKLDSGATCDVLPRELFVKIPKGRQRLRPGPRVKSYGAASRFLNVLGVQTCKLVHRGKVFVNDFVVVDEPGQPAILGLKTCQKMNLIKRVDAISKEERDLPEVVNKYADVFEGLGRLSKEHDIKLKEGATPVVHTARRIPYRLRDKVEARLKEFEAAGVIERVTEPTEWVSPMVVASKPGGDIRICLDPTDLNKAIQRQHFSIPSAEELFGRISKARYFAALDATNGFFQIPLSTEASYLCTMATPFGRFRFLRLPFGVKSAPEVFQCAMQELFGDLVVVEIYFDDFLVWGETKEQLTERLEAVFARCRETNLKLNLRKCDFFVQSLVWLGHVIVEGGLQADPAKVDAILNMPEPKDKQDLVRLLGMVTYLDKFCKDLSTLARPLRDLLKESAEWTWDAQQRTALNKLKDVISSLPVLKLYDPDQPLMVSVDASPVGIGAVLLQEGQPVSFSSVTLTDTQKRYVQIEKELLAVQFGLDRFRQYIYGQPVVVETDHKPLVGLVEKPIASCSPRIQRMRLQLQRHDFILVYKPGRELFIADTLSRAPRPALYEEDPSQQSSEQVHVIVESVIPSQDTRARYVSATEADPTLPLVRELIEKGWPEHKRNCPVPAKPYWSVRDDLTVADDLILRGEAVVIPHSLRQEVLSRIHHGHYGEVKCVERARSSVYWPGYSDQIRNMVASCSICQENRCQNPSQPLHPVELPEYPFEKVGADLFEFQGTHYILLVDYYSKWPSVAPLKSITSAAVISETERIFSDFGVPSVFMSDNGTQFASAEFRSFCQKKGIRQTTSSPEYPQSNGMAEVTVKTVKQRLLKMFQEGETLWDALAAIRSAPVSSKLPSPSVLLQGRNLKGSLPFIHSSALKPRFVSSETVREQLQQQQATTSFNKARSPDVRGSALYVGQNVRARVSRKWIKGKVIQVCQQPHSYIVQLLDGRQFRRTRRAINIDRSPSTGANDRDLPVGAADLVPASNPAVVTPPSASPVQQEMTVQPSGGRASPSSLNVTVVGTPFNGFTPPVVPADSYLDPSRGFTRSGRSYLAQPRNLFK